MDTLNNSKSVNFIHFISSFISLTIIASIFSYRLLNSFLDNIFFPLLDLLILPDKKFHKLTTVYNSNLQKNDTEIKEDNLQYIIRPGIFLKDFITWVFVIIILYILYKITN